MLNPDDFFHDPWASVLSRSWGFLRSCEAEWISLIYSVLYLGQIMERKMQKCLDIEYNMKTCLTFSLPYMTEISVVIRQ